MPDQTFASLESELQQGSRVGEYIIEEVLGEGGFGTVYRGTHPVIGKSAAVKILKREFSSNPEMVSRFIAEARAVNQIRHRNIIDIFAFGTLEDGRHYYVMELLEGTTLDRLILARGHLEPAEAFPIFRQLGRALGAVHAAGITHRDLKPENVFLTYDDDGQPIPKLLDFGIAKLLVGDTQQHHKTRSGTPMGTPLYMSPEQVHGRDVDHRTDIYAFGILVHESLTGAPPFDGESVMDVLTKQTSATPQPMSQLASLPRELDAPVLAMLEKDPAKRPQSITLAVDRLTEAAESAGIAAKRISGARSGPLLIPSARSSQGRRTPGEAPPSTLRAPAPSGSGGGLSSGAGALAQTLDPNRRDSDESTSRPPTNRRKWVVGIAAGCVLGAVGVAAFASASMFRAPTSSASSATASSAAAPKTSSSAPSPDASSPVVTAAGDSADHVKISIEGNTDGIEVFVGSEKVGQSGAPVALPRSGSRVRLTLKKAGFVPRDVWVTPAHDLTLSTELTKSPGAPVSKPLSGKSSATPVAGPRSSSELEF
jgi:serine/threonine-protein kinase